MVLLYLLQPHSRPCYAIAANERVLEPAADKSGSLLGHVRSLSICRPFVPCAVLWLFTKTGESRLVLRPKTTEDVSEILKYCNDKNIAMCPQAGNTGVSGGSVALFDEVVLSTQRMNDIIDFNPVSGMYVRLLC